MLFRFIRLRLGADLRVAALGKQAEWRTTLRAVQIGAANRNRGKPRGVQRDDSEDSPHPRQHFRGRGQFRQWHSEAAKHRTE